MRETKVFLLAILASSEAKGGNYSALLPSSSACSFVFSMGLQVIFHYFSEQHFMTFMDLSGEHSLNAFRCTQGKFLRPLNIYKSWDKFDFGPEINTSSVTSLPTTQGYFIRCNKEDIIDHFYAKVLKHNPKTMLMFQLLDQSYDSAKEILRVGYEKYKILNVAVFVHIEKFTDGRPKGSLCMYNPFSGNDKVRTPDFHCINFTVVGFLQQLNEIGEFLKSRTSNLQRFPIRVDIFEYPMTCKAVYGPNKTIARYAYTDGELAHIASQMMNFTPIYITPLDGKFGQIYPNGSFSGSLAALEYEKVDLVANARLISDYQTTKSVFLEPIVTEKFKFFIQRRETKRQLMISLLTQYDLPSRIITIALMVIFPIVFLLIKVGEAKILRTRNKHSLAGTALYTFALQHNVSVTQSRFASSRIIVITIVFYALIVTSLFQGTIIKNLNTNQNVGSIKTIEGLLDNDYTMLITHTLKSIFKAQSGDRLRDKLNQIARKSPGTDTEGGLASLMKNKNVAFLWAGLYTTNYLNRYYDATTGKNLLEVIPETAFEFYIAMMAPKASPFLNQFNDLILRFIESGLNIYQIRLAFYDNDAIWYQRMAKGLTPKEQSLSLNLKDLATVFKLWAGSIAVCLLEFLIELLIFCLKGKGRKI